LKVKIGLGQIKLNRQQKRRGVSPSSIRQSRLLGIVIYPLVFVPIGVFTPLSDDVVVVDGLEVDCAVVFECPLH
jgi:hypothetical protein